MGNGPQIVERLMAALGRLPGIGQKSAERIAYYLWRASNEEAKHLAHAILDLKEKVAHCQRCFHLSEGPLCRICDDARRDAAVVCVVEQPKDVMAMEKTGMYNGVYHVLLGSIAPLDGIGPERLTIEALLARLRGGGHQEIILATDADQEGEATALYLTRQLRPLGVRITRLASGIPVGSQLEYADQATLAKALTGRHEVPAA